MMKACLCLLFSAVVSAGFAQAVPVADTDVVKAGSRFENLKKDWKPVLESDVWTAVSDTEIHIANPAVKTKVKAPEPILTRAIEQSGVMAYEWSVKLPDFEPACVFNFFSSDPANRNSYAVWMWIATDKATRRKTQRLNLDKITDSKLVPLKYVDTKFKNSEWNDMKVRFDSAKGDFTVWCNGKEVIKIIDPKPFKSGGYAGLYTSSKTGAFKDVSIKMLTE